MAHKPRPELSCKLHHAGSPLPGDCPHITLRHFTPEDPARTRREETQVQGGRGVVKQQAEPHLLSPTPNPYLQASQSLRRCPSASAPDTSIYVPVSALLFFLCSSNFNILLLSPHEKSCLPSVPFILLWTNWWYSSNCPPLDFGISLM